MYLKKLNVLFEQVITFLQKDNKLSKEECGCAVCADCGGGGAGITTGQALGPDTPETSIANTMKEPPKCSHTGRAGITTRDVLPMYTPGLPYRTFKRKKKKKKKSSRV